METPFSFDYYIVKRDSQYLSLGGDWSDSRDDALKFETLAQAWQVVDESENPRECSVWRWFPPGEFACSREGMIGTVIVNCTAHDCDGQSGFSMGGTIFGGTIEIL